MDCSPPGSSVHGILQAKIIEWLPFPSPGNLPDPGIKLGLPELQVLGERGESCIVLAALEEVPCGLLWAASTGAAVCLLVNVLVFSLSP